MSRYVRSNRTLRAFLIAPALVPAAMPILAGWGIVDVDSPERAHEIAAKGSPAPGPDGRPLNMAIEVRRIME